MLNRDFQSIDLQRRALDAAWLRQGVLSNNIANVDTPGFKRQDVDFDSMLKGFLDSRRLSMTQTNARHFGGDYSALIGLKPRVYTDNSTSFRLDGNNVNIDVEMAQLAQNNVKYNAITGQVNAQIKRLKAAIRGDL